MQSIKIYRTNKIIKGTIKLSGSKSISNRVLMIQAICGNPFQIENISDSDDTQTLIRLLETKDSVLDCHHAGTTFRFLTAFLAFSERTVTLTGSERMQQRPVGPLVDALRNCGASIDYLGKEGYPPLQINPPVSEPSETLRLPANISSQYISALLMVAPTFRKGLIIELEGSVVSKPYIEMTIGIMNYFGVEVSWNDNILTIPNASYQPREFYVEADWSAASYYYAIAGLSDKADIKLEGLMENSLQGDAQITEICRKFGLITDYENRAIVIRKLKDVQPPAFFEYDFIQQPDIVQSIAVLAAGLGVHCVYTGLQTLRIKETDRIKALQTELAKFNVFLSAVPPRFSGKSGKEYFMQEGEVSTDTENIKIETYNDHRMAMSFAVLSVLISVIIQDAEVVSKSYPSFWKDLERLGFSMDLGI
ncbi:MAG: 3-phosphoshikimate 1-carboxyvinyltransferase [Saprospiraceae bacterium]|nr:3-phosphoshikimate 1-carboxyvinyltransferase [Saprospiraceae bacterium]